MNSKMKSKSISDSDYDEIIYHVMKAEEIANNTLVSEQALGQVKDYIEGNHRQPDIILFSQGLFKWTEAVFRRCSVKKRFGKFHKTQRETPVPVSSLIKLQAASEWIVWLLLNPYSAVFKILSNIYDGAFFRK